MGLTFQEINKLNCNHLEINDKLVSKNVRFNDASDNHLAVYDNTGKKVFWVNDDGCSIKVQDSVTELYDIIGFPKLEEGLLCVSGEELDFLKDISLTSLEAQKINVDNLVVKHLDIKNITLPSLSAGSIINNLLTSDKIKTDDANITLLTNDKLVSNDISSNHIKTYKLDVEIFEPSDISAGSIKTNKVECEEALITELQTAHAGIVILETKQIMANELKIIDLANIKLLNCEEANIEYLNVVDASFITLHANKIIQPIAYFGSLEEPLKLNMVDCPILDCNNEQNILQIFNKIHDKTPQNKVELINLPDKDYHIETKCYNQYINVSYNICRVNNKTFLFTKFNDVTRDLVVQIILKPI